MPVRIFASLNDCLSLPLSKIINASYSLGIFPEDLKLARLTPVYKRGNKQDPSNYRPISSLPYISKIFERNITNQLTSYFDKHRLISKFQFGFQKNITTADALIHLTEAIYNSLNHKQHFLSILIDLKKAFDTMNHDILLKKLDLYGVRGVPLALIRSYLTDRPCYVSINNANSSLKNMNIGIPQGSIIGPLLFLIFINDLPNVSKIFETFLFADDTTLSASHKDFPQLVQLTNAELTKIHDWTVSNRLTINVDKTELIIFSNRDYDLQSQQVSLNSQLVNSVNSCKFLGTHIDRNLTFSQHIKSVVGKLSRGAGILYRIRGNLTREARMDYYYGMLYPYMTYNALVWGTTYLSHLQPLIVQQKRIIRLITDASATAHCDPLFKELGLLKITDISKFQVLVHMFRSNKNKYQVNHDLNTRYRGLLRPSFHNLTKTQHAISYIGPLEWNKLPSEIKVSPTIKSFKKRLKAYFIEQYE